MSPASGRRRTRTSGANGNTDGLIVGALALVVLLGGTVVVGTSTGISLGEVQTGVLPALPILGALPEPGDLPGATWALMLVPALAVGLGAVSLVRDVAELERREQITAWIAYPVVVVVAVLLLAGLTLVQLATGNRLVRLVLVTTGALPAGPVTGGVDGELRGGRLLGPLERLFILGLGLAGELTAAGLVIAAKGLIRWPELRSHARSEDDTRASDIDKVTEYFLVGSFVSWLVALGGLLLAA